MRDIETFCGYQLNSWKVLLKSNLGPSRLVQNVSKTYKFVKFDFFLASQRRLRSSGGKTIRGSTSGYLKSVCVVCKHGLLNTNEPIKDLQNGDSGNNYCVSERDPLNDSLYWGFINRFSLIPFGNKDKFQSDIC